MESIRRKQKSLAALKVTTVGARQGQRLQLDGHRTGRSTSGIDNDCGPRMSFRQVRSVKSSMERTSEDFENRPGLQT